MSAKTEDVEAAKARITKYLSELAKMRGIDKEDIAGLHSGDEREAVLTVSDLRTLLASHAAQAEEIAAQSRLITDQDAGLAKYEVKLARAIEVVRPFAEAFRSLSSRWLDHEDHWADAIIPPNVGDLRRAAAYISDNEGGA